MAAIPIISIVGKSGSGKTTLIEKLVPILKGRGYRVGTIKHDAHSFEMDHEGKDSFRHFHSGAEAAVICSAEKVAMNRRLSSPLSIDKIAQELLGDMDIIITEGYKSADKPKIEVVRAARSETPICAEEDCLIAIASDMQLQSPVPLLSIDDAEGIADLIASRFLKGAGA